MRGSRARAAALAMGFLLMGPSLRTAGAQNASASPGISAPGISAPATEEAREAAAFPHERDVADEVLRRPEFQRNVSKTWWERKKEQLLGVLEHMLERMNRLGHAAPWLAKTLEWGLFGGAAVGLLVFLLRQMQRQRLHVSLGEGAVRAEVWSREAEDWWQRAESFANDEAWREAVHCLYWAAIVLLESRRAWRHNPTRTPREYVRLLRAGSAQQEGLRGLTRIFERTWYGLRETDSAEYAQARSLYEALAANHSASAAQRVEPLQASPAEGL